MPLVFVKNMNTSRLCIMIKAIVCKTNDVRGELTHGTSPWDTTTTTGHTMLACLHIHKIVDSSSSADKGFSVMLSWQAPCLE